jgi:hypothetical protein
MSIETGTIIGASNKPLGAVVDGEPGVDANPNSDIGNAGRTDGDSSVPEPLIIHGYEPSTGDFEPVSESAGSGSVFGEPAKQRRKRGPNKSKSVEPTSISPNLGELDFAAILMSGHSMLAALTGVEELDMSDQKEADKLAKRIKEALKFHGNGISPQKLAYINLGFAITEIYGSRALAYRLRTKVERETRPKPTPINSGKTAAPAAPPQQKQASPSAPIATGTFGAISPEQLWNAGAEE